MNAPSGVLAGLLRHWPLIWGIGGSAVLVVALAGCWREWGLLWGWRRGA